MRRIQPDETCLTAEEIVNRFAELTGHALHPTNAGNAAKVIGLDYVVTPVVAAWGKGRKLYAEADVPRIFERLQALADERAKWQ